MKTETKLIRLNTSLADWLKGEAAKNRRTQPAELALIIEAERDRRATAPVVCCCPAGEPCPQDQAPTS